MYIQGTQKFNPDPFFEIDLQLPLDLVICFSCNTYISRLHTDSEGKVDVNTICTICHENKNYAEAK